MQVRAQIMSCALFSLCVAAIAGFPGMLRAEAPDLATIQASLESLRASAGITHTKYKVTVRIIKGSQNEFMDPPRSPGSGVDVPSEDLVIQTPPMERLFDFRRNRSWSKGSIVQCSIDKDAAGIEKLVPYFEFSEAASDGVEIISICPKERIDPRSISKGVKVPVEVHRVKVKDDTQRQTTDKTLYPLFLSEGSLPSPDSPLGGRDKLPAIAPEKWRVSGTTVLDGHQCPVLVSAPSANSEYHEYTLRPDLHYVACRWVRYYKGDPIEVTTIKYQRPDGGRPRLQSWNVSTYHPRGVLYHEESFAVETVKHLDSVDDSLFRLKPDDGMIVIDWDDNQFHIAGNEAASFTTLFEANDYLERHNSSWSWLWILSIGALLVASVGGVAAWARWKATK